MCRRDGAVVGVVPLAVDGRTARFGGANLGDRFHPAAAESDEREVAAAAGEAIAGRCATVVLDNVPPELWADALVASAGLVSAPRVDAAWKRLPYVDLDGTTFDDYLASRKGHFRANMRRRLRQLEDGRAVRFRRSETDDEVLRDLDTFFGLHERRWDERGGSGSLTETSKAFHRDVAAATHARGWLRLWTLEVDGRAIGSWYGWRIGPRYAFYLGGFDPEWSRYGVGVLLVSHTLRAAFEEGAGEYDFLLGDEAYKESFATGERRATTVVATRRFHPARLAALADATLRRASRTLPPRARERVRRAAGVVVRRLPTARGR